MSCEYFSGCSAFTHYPKWASPSAKLSTRSENRIEPVQNSEPTDSVPRDINKLNNQSINLNRDLDQPVRAEDAESLALLPNWNRWYEQSKQTGRFISGMDLGNAQLWSDRGIDLEDEEALNEGLSKLPIRQLEARWKEANVKA
jgi:hypothetical protein